MADWHGTARPPKKRGLARHGLQNVVARHGTRHESTKAKKTKKWYKKCFNHGFDALFLFLRSVLVIISVFWYVAGVWYCFYSKKVSVEKAKFFPKMSCGTARHGTLSKFSLTGTARHGTLSIFFLTGTARHRAVPVVPCRAVPVISNPAKEPFYRGEPPAPPCMALRVRS